MVISIIRTFILYVLVIITLRILGKRQIGELEPAELAVTILISELAAIPMQDTGIPLMQGIIPIAVLLALEFIATTLIMKFQPLSRLMSGKSNVLFADGKILEKELKRSRITISEFIEGLRLLGVTDFNSIKYAILETNGKLSVIKRDLFENVSKKDMGIQGQERGLPVLIISDGKVNEGLLKQKNKSREWLENELNTRDISCPEQVFVMILDELDNVYIVEKEKNK